MLQANYSQEIKDECTQRVPTEMNGPILNKGKGFFMEKYKLSSKQFCTESYNRVHDKF